MGITRADLTDQRFTEQDRSEMKVVVDRCLANEEWVQKTEQPVAILLTGHPGSRPYLKASIETHKKTGYWVCLAYDNYLDPENLNIQYESIMPATEVMNMLDTFFVPHHQTWGGCLFPYYWMLKWGASILRDFEYIYCSNADCVLEKPEGFGDLLKLMGDADFMSCGPVLERSINTTGFIVKTEALKKIMDHFGEHFVPFDNYEKYTQEYGNAEGRMFRAIQELGLKQVIVDPPENDQIPAPGKGTWFDLVGFRHIHHEHNYAYRYKGIPPEIEYFDERFMGDEYRSIKEYWKTKDIKILENWWCGNE